MSSYKADILEFKRLYMSLGISVTPKVKRDYLKPKKYYFFNIRPRIVKNKINDFKKSYFKAHMVFQHIAEFLDLVNGDTETPNVGMFKYFKILLLSFNLIGLGYFSEQAFESMHHDVKVS